MAEEQSVGAAAGKGALAGAGTGAAFGPWGAAVGGVVGAGVGIWQATSANKALKNLANKPMPNYTLSSEQKDYYNRANAASQYGYTGAQTAAFKQNVAQQYNTGYRNAVNQSGGNMAQAIANGLGQQKLGAFNQFAADDAALQQRKFNQLGGVVNGVQGQYNLATGENIHRRYALEQAYGGAMKAGLENSMNGFNNALAAGLQAKGGMNNNNPQSAGGYMQQSFSNPVGQGYGAGSNYNLNSGSNPYASEVPQYNMQDYGVMPPVTTPNPY